MCVYKAELYAYHGINLECQLQQRAYPNYINISFANSNAIAQDSLQCVCKKHPGKEVGHAGLICRAEYNDYA